MTLYIPQAGQDAILKNALGLVTPANLLLKLFVNSYTPAAGDSAASYTEMSTLGYAAKTLSMASWTESEVIGVGTAVYAAQTFTFTAGTAVTIYGYFVVGATDGIIRWAELFATPFIAQYTGDSVVLTPQFTLT
jgi:hypothetical protein